jgi:hypothetical protein
LSTPTVDQVIASRSGRTAGVWSSAILAGDAGLMAVVSDADWA